MWDLDISLLGSDMQKWALTRVLSIYKQIRLKRGWNTKSYMYKSHLYDDIIYVPCSELASVFCSSCDTYYLMTIRLSVSLYCIGCSQCVLLGITLSIVFFLRCWGIFFIGNCILLSTYSMYIVFISQFLFLKLVITECWQSHFHLKMLNPCYC